MATTNEKKTNHPFAFDSVECVHSQLYIEEFSSSWLVVCHIMPTTVASDIVTISELETATLTSYPKLEIQTKNRNRKQQHRQLLPVVLCHNQRDKLDDEAAPEDGKEIMAATQKQHQKLNRNPEFQQEFVYECCTRQKND